MRISGSNAEFNAGTLAGGGASTMEACYTVGVNQSDDAFGAARDLARDMAHDFHKWPL